MSSTSEMTGSYAYTDTLKGVYYGPGATKTALPKLLDVVGAKKAFVVTGRSLFTKVPLHSQWARPMSGYSPERCRRML